MGHDPARVAETREWLQKAALDFRGAAIDLDAEPPLLEDALFHCQQAVEKALKEFLAWHDVPFGKTHSLLVHGCADIDDRISWDIVQSKLPTLLREVDSFLK